MYRQLPTERESAITPTSIDRKSTELFRISTEVGLISIFVNILFLRCHLYMIF